MAENFKDVEINGRKFRIRKFGARDGSFIVIKVGGLLAPIFGKLDFTALKDVKKPEDVNLGKFDLAGAISELTKLSESDFNYLQGKCLGVCSEPLGAGFTPVLNDNGSFGVTGLEEDAMTVMALTVHALVFNLTGFFQGSPLSGFVNGLFGTTQLG